MKHKIGAYLTMLAGVLLFLSGCEGGSDTTAQVPVFAVNNPVLARYSTLVVANFSNYTTYVKFGSPITFSVTPAPASSSHVNLATATFSPISTVYARTVRTDVAGRAWVTLRSPVPGKFIVTAVSGNVNGTSSNVGGTTTVSFIDQPAAVSVRVGLRRPLTNVAHLDFDLISTEPAPAFVNFSGIQSPLILAQDTTPLLPANGVATTNLHITSFKGININGSSTKNLPQWRFDYIPVTPSVPNFTLANISASAADLNATPLPLVLFMKTTYYDSLGNEIFY